MKQLLMGLMLLLTATAASAEWTVVNVDDESVGYVDRATIRRSGNFVKMWFLWDYKKAREIGGKSTLSGRNQYEYDCKEEKVRSLALTTFSGQMGNGTVNYTDSDTGKWSPVAPDSVGETVWKIACGKK